MLICPRTASGLSFFMRNHRMIHRKNVVLVVNPFIQVIKIQLKPGTRKRSGSTKTPHLKPSKRTMRLVGKDLSHLRENWTKAIKRDKVNKCDEGKCDESTEKWQDHAPVPQQGQPVEQQQQPMHEAQQLTGSSSGSRHTLPHIFTLPDCVHVGTFSPLLSGGHDIMLPSLDCRRLISQR